MARVAGKLAKKTKRRGAVVAGAKPRKAAPRGVPTRPPRAVLLRAPRVLAGLEKLYPQADCALAHGSALELLIATILSAQSTDANVNRVTPGLFARYPDAKALAGAAAADMEREIHSTGFFRQKTKSVLGACRRIVEAYGGKVPDTMEDLLTLPGVARKTANVILGTWFRKNEGVVVDTHVGRLAHRLGLTWTSRNEKDAVRIESDLMQVLPRESWTFFGHAMIFHGRQVCTAKKPACERCLLAGDCPSAFTFPHQKRARASRSAKKASPVRRR